MLTTTRTESLPDYRQEGASEPSRREQIRALMIAGYTATEAKRIMGKHHVPDADADAHAASDEEFGNRDRELIRGLRRKVPKMPWRVTS